MMDIFTDVFLLQLCTVITVALGVEPSFDMPVVNVTVTEMETAILPCSVRFLGNHQVIWSDQSSMLLTHEDRRIIDDERLSVERPFTKDWNLHIRKVQYKDQGVYTCQINTIPVKIKTVNLKVEVPSKIIDDLSSVNTVVREGDKVTLVCNVTGVPTPDVTWYRHVSDEKGAKKQSEFCPGTHKVGVKGEVLIIHNITRYCGDIYECVAFNGVPPAVSRQIQVSVEFAPEIYMPNKRIGQDLSKETILECTVTAFPHAVSMWMRNGEKISTQPQKYRLEIYPEENNAITLSLRIFGIEQQDYGEYTCVASNTLGEDSESMFLYQYSTYVKTTTSSTTLPTTPRTSTEILRQVYLDSKTLTILHYPSKNNAFNNGHVDTHKPITVPNPWRPQTPGQDSRGQVLESNMKRNQASGFVFCTWSLVLTYTPFLTTSLLLSPDS